MRKYTYMIPGFTYGSNLTLSYLGRQVHRGERIACTRPGAVAPPSGDRTRGGKCPIGYTGRYGGGMMQNSEGPLAAPFKLSSFEQFRAMLSSHRSLAASLSLFNAWIFAMSWSGGT